MSFQTVNFSGTASNTSGFQSTTGTFTASVTGNADGTVTGTWTFNGTYTDNYYASTGQESLSGTLAGSGPDGGPWTLVLQGNGASNLGATLSFANGQYTLGATVGFSAGVTVDGGGYDGQYVFNESFTLHANLVASAPGPAGVATDGADTLTGTAGNDVIMALGGNDTITATAGNDTIDGGAGIDTVVFGDARANYTITNQGNGTFTVAHTGAETTTLTNVERLTFADAKVALDINGNAGEAYRLYQAAFDRTPDLAGLGFNIHSLDVGLTLGQVAQQFITSAEFQQAHGTNLTDSEWVTLLYQNVLHRAPEQAGFDFHMWELSVGFSRADQLAEFSESPENQANVLGQIQNGMAFVG